MHCQKCGLELSDGATSCYSCGTKVSTVFAHKPTIGVILASFSVCLSYFLLWNSPVWPLDLYLISGVDIGWIPYPVLYFPVAYGVFVLFLLLAAAGLNLFTDRIPKIIAGLLWGFIGVEFLFSTLVVGMNLARGEFRQSFWGSGTIGLIVLGVILIMLSIHQFFVMLKK